MSVMLDNEQISKFVADWYRALDEHVPLSEVAEYLVTDGLTMQFPEGILKGRDEFAQWYETVTHRFFDEVHEVTSVTSQINRDADEAEVQVMVNWQARIWEPPAANSQWLGFDADQTWRVVLDPAGRIRVSSYVVNGLAAMPGSSEL